MGTHRTMPIIAEQPRCAEQSSVQIYEFQGVFEEIGGFNGVYDPSQCKMQFQGFELDGRAKNEQYTVLERLPEGLRVVGRVNEVVLFDKYPRYVVSKNKNGTERMS